MELLVRVAPDEEDLAVALKTAFQHTAARVRSCHNEHFDALASGCTVTVAVTRGTELFTAHLGDSRAVAGYRDGRGGLKAVALTSDHKPEIVAEKARILRSGGEVKRLEGDVPHRVFKKDCPFPGLAMSRAMGDLLAQEVGVIDVPEINRYMITGDMRVIVLCSDGVWEFVSDEEAIKIVAKHGPGKAAEAAEELASVSWDRWIAEEEDVVDDITAVVVWLHGLEDG
mmetsp:Transcript_8611/g.18548  ORF Transcript_8611/g.18548 Transcript_8611/m.18548 type:complete len:227 (+) Transcript_8611:1-681(+)